MTEPTDGADADALQAEARRRAEARRTSGELPADIDDRLRDDVIRAMRRSADRGPIDTEAALSRAAAFPTPAEGGGARGRLVLRLKERVGRLAERTHLLDALRTVDAEQRRQARLVDDTAAQLDALAARITALERWAAVPGLAALPGPAVRTTMSDHDTVATLTAASLVQIDDDGSDPAPLAAAARTVLRRGGRLVVHTDRASAIAEELRDWLEVTIEHLPAPPPLDGDDPLVHRLNILLGLDGRSRVVAIR